MRDSLFALLATVIFALVISSITTIVYENSPDGIAHVLGEAVVQRLPLRR